MSKPDAGENTEREMLSGDAGSISRLRNSIEWQSNYRPLGERFTSAAKTSFLVLVISIGLLAFGMAVSAASPGAGIAVGALLLIVPIIALFRPMKSLGLSHRGVSLITAVFVGFPVFLVAVVMWEDAKQAELIALKKADPSAYLAVLRTEDHSLWLEELEVMDPERHRAELARIEAERASEEAARREEQEAQAARERAERETEAARERAEQEARDAQERAEECGEKNKSLAYIMSQDFIEDRLRAPSTADFPASQRISIQPIEGCRYRVVAYVDAQNAFGAMIRSHYEAVMELEPGTTYWRLISLDFEE